MTTQPTTWTEQVARPDGTVYRAQRGPRVEEFADADLLVAGYLVTRTHDLDVATALVEHAWGCEFGGPVTPPLRRWVRLVPWDSFGSSQSSWADVLPHERSAIPAVEFRYEEQW